MFLCRSPFVGNFGVGKRNANAAESVPFLNEVSGARASSSEFQLSNFGGLRLIAFEGVCK